MTEPRKNTSAIVNCAVVDLGSNTIRMTLYDVQDHGGFLPLFSEKRMAGLVNYIRDGVLSREGIEVACGVLRGFQRMLRQFGDIPMNVFATASLRNIKNTDEVLAAIRERTGLVVEVLSGELEARYGCLGAMLTCPLEGGAVFDIGGGSTEIVLLDNGRITRAESLDIGSLNLYNRYVSELWPDRGDCRRRPEEAAPGTGSGQTGAECAGHRRHRPGGAEDRQPVPGQTGGQPHPDDGRAGPHHRDAAGPQGHRPPADPEILSRPGAHHPAGRDSDEYHRSYTL